MPSEDARAAERKQSLLRCTVLSLPSVHSVFLFLRSARPGAAHGAGHGKSQKPISNAKAKSNHRAKRKALATPRARPTSTSPRVVAWYCQSRPVRAPVSSRAEQNTYVRLVHGRWLLKKSNNLRSRFRSVHLFTLGAGGSRSRASESTPCTMVDISNFRRDNSSNSTTLS